MQRILTYLTAVCFATIMLINTTFAAKENTQQEFTKEQVESIHKIIKNYLIQNPTILLDVSQELRNQKARSDQQKTLSAISQVKDQIFDNKHNPFVGNPSGKEVIAEFFDYQCPHCKETNTVVKGLIKKNPKLKVVLIDWPIFGGASLSAAKAAIAANKQGKYWAMHEALLAAPNPLTEKKILKLANEIGLNLEQLKKDMDDSATQSQIKENFQLAGQLKLTGTPVFIMANQKRDKFNFVLGASSQQNLQNQLNQLK